MEEPWLCNYRYLNWNHHAELMRIFQPKKQGSKLMIPVGLNELVVSEVEERLTANKKLMVVLTISKPKGTYWDDDHERPSYNKLELYHIENRFGNATIGTEWFKPFTSTMPESQLLTMKERFKGKPKFLALVGQRQRPVMRGSTNVVDGLGRQIYMWESYIHSVFKLGTDVRLTMDNYKSLFSYERWPESIMGGASTTTEQSEEEVPF